MTDLLLLGASGLAREVAAGLAGSRRILGLLDDDSSRHGTVLAGLTVLGGLDLAATSTADLLVCVGSGLDRRRMVERLAGQGVGEDRYASFVSPAAHVSAGNRVGAGSILLAGVVLTTNVTVGKHVVVMPNATLTHDDVIGDFVTIAAGVALGGSVVLEDAGYIGMNASIRPGVRIGTGATVGMGAVVLQDVPAGETWADVPARRLDRTPSPTRAVRRPQSRVLP
jgi:sugar O-acyltransferase (sialic acid O-acetyltransferase NeuD family)